MRDHKIGQFICFAVLVLGDVALLNVAFSLAYTALPLLGLITDPDTYHAVAFVVWVLPPLIFYFAGMYRTWDEYAFSKGIDAILTGVVTTMVVLTGVIWTMRERLASISALEATGEVTGEKLSQLVWGFPVRVLVLVVIMAPFFIWIWRIVANSLEHRFLGWTAKTRTILIAGALDLSDVDRLKYNHRPAYSIAGWLTDKPVDESPVPILGGLSRLEEELAAREVDEVFLLAPDFSREALLSAIETCYHHSARPRLVLGIYETLLSATQTELRGSVPVYHFRNASISGWTYVVKRLLDVTVAGLALAVTGPLLVLPACVAIVVESKGWPVFNQIRVGIHGRHFQLHKLRTMVIDADALGGPLTEDDDPRITRVGKFLRKTSIDELPQLWNVIKGDMSLVGPRAVVPYVADQFQEWERVSLTVKPGVTGLAQISGRDEIGFREKSLLNLYYVRNHSIWLDLRIMLDTVAVVLTMEGTGGTRGATETPSAS